MSNEPIDLDKRRRRREAPPLPDPPPGRFDDDGDDGGGGGGRGDLVEIPLGTDTERVVSAAIDALQKDEGIFIRAGSPVRIIESDGTEGGRMQRSIGAPVVRLLTPSFARERLSIVAQFTSLKTEGRGKEKEVVKVNVSAPPLVAVGVVERGTWPGFRALSGVITSPTIRRDGSILQTPGYDAATGLFFVPRAKYRAVAERPTPEDVEAACAALLDVVVDFPLQPKAVAGWLALTLTLVARELVDGPVPLFAIDAPTAGSGKGLLVGCAHRIAFGHDVAHMSAPPTDEEFRKQITTTLLSGDPAALIDNVSAPLGGDSLDAVVTAPIWKVRLLGKNEDSGALEPRLVWLVTGNGLEFVGDLGRRTLRIRIEPKVEKPEEREGTDFVHPDRAGVGPMLAWVNENRVDLVHAALTVLRAWHVAGRPSKVKAWGSFESWAETIGACVQWLGLEDPTLGRASSEPMLDPTKAALSVVYAAIEKLDVSLVEGGAKGVTARELVKATEPKRDAYGRPTDEPTGFEELAEAIETLAPRGDAASKARVLGRKLKAGRIIDGKILVAIPAEARSVRYRVEPAK